MAAQILLNVFIAFIWMFIESSFSGASFIVGYILGLGIILLMRRFFDSRFYLLRVFAIIKLFLIFIRELILSNFAVLKVVLKPKLDIQPGIFEYKTRLKADWEIALLSNLITLTPGTLVVNVSKDHSTLYIHSMDVPDVNSAIESIRNSFEKSIIEVSR